MNPMISRLKNEFYRLTHTVKLTKLNVRACICLLAEMFAFELTFTIALEISFTH